MVAHHAPFEHRLLWLGIRPSRPEPPFTGVYRTRIKPSPLKQRGRAGWTVVVLASLRSLAIERRDVSRSAGRLSHFQEMRCGIAATPERSRPREAIE